MAGVSFLSSQNHQNSHDVLVSPALQNDQLPCVWAGFCSALLSTQNNDVPKGCLFCSVLAAQKITQWGSMSAFSSLCSKSMYSAKTGVAGRMSGFSGSSKSKEYPFMDWFLPCSSLNPKYSLAQSMSVLLWLLKQSRKEFMSLVSHAAWLADSLLKISNVMIGFSGPNTCRPRTCCGLLSKSTFVRAYVSLAV